jgi:pyruvate ferredoxin oxidoreductase alpha subunit
VREQLEGSRAIAETVANCRVQVVPAYPITPQTHIVEALGAMVKDGSLPGCEFLTVESEFAAMSAAIGASAAGARSYTATASQGLLYMAEALFNASGMGLPVVMTVANRAIGAPINIWNDHSDAMSQRDCGWIQLYADTNQSAVDLHVIAFRLAEQLRVPVMVCVDGFVLTHAFEPIDVPERAQVDRLLVHRGPATLLDPDEPITVGAMVGPEAFTEVRYLADARLRAAAGAYDAAAAGWRDISGRPAPMIERYGPADAPTVVLALGSVTGALRDVVDERADVAVITLRLFRPFPAARLRAALGGAAHVLVLERAFAPGAGGVVSPDVCTALAGGGPRVRTVVAGLGGRPVTRASLLRLLDAAAAGDLPEFSFLDLDSAVVHRESGVPAGGGL